MKFDYEDALWREDATCVLRAHWNPRRCAQTVLVADALGRVTAQPVAASVTLPVCRSSQRDGIAVKAAAWSDGDPDISGWQRGVDWVAADTGDDFADEFDAIVSAEEVERDEDGNLISIQEGLAVEPGRGVNPAGATIKAGDVVVDAGTVLTPELLCACAAAGAYQLSVVRKPRVGFIPTGSELVAAGTVPQRGQNLETNSLMVAAFLREWGCEPVVFPIVRDAREPLRAALEEALDTCDIVLVNAGTSRGEEDFNAQLIQERASYFSHGIRAVPGRPVGLAVVDNKPVINVPGPNIACWLAMDWLVRDLVAYALGTRTHKRPTVTARLGFEVKPMPLMERFTRVLLERSGDGSLAAKPLPKGWGGPMTLARTDAIFVVPAGGDPWPVGTEVEVELLRPIEDILGPAEEPECACGCKAAKPKPAPVHECGCC